MTPHEEGERASRLKQGMSNNPHREGSVEHAEWTEGFVAAGGGLESDDEENEEGKGI